MTGGWMLRPLGRVVLAGFVWCIVLEFPAQSQTKDDPVALNAEVLRLYRAGKYAEATQIAKRQLALAEKAQGIDHPNVGASLTNLVRLSSLPEIGQILGHRSPQSTAIYAKVDLQSLRTIALPWPGGVR